MKPGRATNAIIPPQGITAEQTFLIAEIKMLGVICELGVPETSAEGPATADAIAERVGAQADAIERVIRFLASLGSLRRKRDGRYVLNARSRALRADDAQSRAIG